MKKIYLLLMALVFCVGLNAQNMATIEQELQEVLNQKGDEMISVNIILKSQIDNEKLISRLNNIKAKEDKKEFVISELKEFASSNQSDVMSILQSEERSLNVVDIQSHWMVNMINCTATKDVIYYLSEHPDVFIIGHNKFEKLIDDVTPVKAEPKRGMVENVTKVGANEVWEEGYTGEGVIVAVLDTGVNTDHVDLADHLWDGGSAYPGHGWNCVENNANTKDFHSHGTHCAGTICGDGTSGTQTGMAPDATLMCIKILNDNGEGTFNDFVEGVEFAIDNGADVMSISVGWRYPNVDVSEGMRTLFENVLSAGVVASVAAGNDRDLIDSYPVPRNINSPGNCPPPWLSPDQEANPGGLSAVVCVGAVDYSDVSAYFSSQGPVRWSNTQWGDYPYDPEYTDPSDENCLYYDNGTHEMSIGLGVGYSFYWAVKFKPEDLQDYAGTTLTKLSMYDVAPHTGYFYIYQGGDSAPQTPVNYQAYTCTGTGAFVDFDLEYPTDIDATQPLWIIAVNDPVVDYPASASSFTGDADGSWCSFDGVTWTDIAAPTMLGQPLTWMIRGYVSAGAKGETVYEPLEIKPVAECATASDIITSGKSSDNAKDITPFGLIRPDVSAPGVDIISAAYDDNSGFYYMSGTSMATPCVAGVMALLLDKNPELTPADICRALETTATPLDNKKSNLTGSGRINALAAIEDMGDDAPVTSYDFENGMGRWTSINANNDSHTWFHSNDSDEHSNSNITPHTGTGCMLNESYCYGYSPELVIGEGTSTIAQLPIYEYYSYTLSQQIYTADEMQGASGEITSVSFRQKQEYADTRHVDIYMMNTTKENFNTVSDWMTVSEDNLVYSGEIDYSSMEDGWMSIQLDNTFQYTGDNVLLCMVDNTGSWRNATEFYSYQTGSASRALYAFTDNAPYDPFNPSYTGNLSDYNTQVKFNFASVSLGNITPDDYLVSPKKILATDNSKISFWACGRETNYSQEHFGVAVSTTGKTSASDFTTIAEWTINASKYGDAKPREGNGAKSDNTTWIRYEADLSQYAGQEIWVAIRHFDCEGQSALCIDDVEIIRYVEEVGNHWNPDPTLYANNMTLIASVSINGEIQSNLDLELGAFCGEEVRGSVMAQYVTAPVNKYEFFIMIYGNANDVITFRLYDHYTHTELDLTSDYSLSFVVNGSVGDITSPEIVNFASVRYITLVSNIEGAGVLSGEGEYCTGDTVTIYASANDGYVFRNWTLDDVVVSYDTYYGFYASEDATYMANFEYLQQEELNSGWNWYSTYITVEGEDGLEMMKEGLGEDAVQIKNHSAFANYELGIWYGGLKEMSNEEMYMIKMSSPNTLEMTGTYDDPSSHPITLGTNWKWIGYPVNAAMPVDEAFSNITPNNGDYVKSQSHFAQYYEGLGWTGTLSVMEPGNGYMYQNTSGYNKTLVYPTPSSKEAVASNVTTDDNHWAVDYGRYPTNMTIIAVVEGAGSNYEVAAFSNGDCRGSAKAIYVEQLDSYMVFLTVYGEDNDKMSFRFYDAENDEEYAINESMIFEVDASVGDVMDAYMMTIAATGMNETLSFSIYPNPVGGKEEIRLGGEYDVVEVYNSIGVKVAEYKNVSKIDGLETSGVYVIKIVEDDKIAYDRIVVK